MRCCSLIQDIILGIVPTEVVPPAPAQLTMVYDDIVNAPVIDPTNVDDWNTFLVGTIPAFTVCTVVGNTVYLEGGVGLDLNPGIFSNSTSILTFSDPTGMVTEVPLSTFGYSSIVTVNLSGLTYLNNSVFYNCVNLVTCTIPNATSIGDSAFFQCSSLTSFSSTATTSIGNSSFESCSALTTCTMPNVTSIGNLAFKSCNTLPSATFPVAITVGNSAFQDCTLLTAVDLRLATTLGTSCFQGSPLTGVLRFDSVTTLSGVSAFRACSFTTISMPLLTSVPIVFNGGCFELNTNLTTLSFPILTAIGGNFVGFCSALTSLSLPLCTDFGGTTGDDEIFMPIAGNTITLTVPTSLATCNAGNPDGDIQYLSANNTATINYV